MSKAISSYKKAEQDKVIERRLKGKTGGLGHWAAVDAKAKK